MEAKDFNAWIEHMGFNDSEVARRLDISRNSVAKYKAEGAPDYIGYACSAIAAGLPVWASTEVSRSAPQFIEWLKNHGSRAIWRQEIFNRRKEMAHIDGIYSFDLVHFPVSDRPLGEAIRLIAEGDEDNMFTGALVLFGDGQRLTHADCVEMLKHYGERL